VQKQDATKIILHKSCRKCYQILRHSYLHPPKNAEDNHQTEPC